MSITTQQEASISGHTNKEIYEQCDHENPNMAEWSYTTRKQRLHGVKCQGKCGLVFGVTLKKQKKGSGLAGYHCRCCEGREKVGRVVVTVNCGYAICHACY
jgi:hypothetical protein